MSNRAALTPPDLVILAVLAEEPRHGYDLNAELERRDVRDWASISRPQVYYSLRKLARHGHIAPAELNTPSAGPERTTYAVTDVGREALRVALGAPAWATAHTPPMFLTWLALCAQTDPHTRAQVIRAREAIVEARLAHERTTLRAIKADDGVMVPAAALMVELTVAQLKVERAWLRRVRARLLPDG